MWFAGAAAAHVHAAWWVRPSSSSCAVKPAVQEAFVRGEFMHACTAHLHASVRMHACTRGTPPQPRSQGLGRHPAVAPSHAHCTFSLTRNAHGPLRLWSWATHAHAHGREGRETVGLSWRRSGSWLHACRWGRVPGCRRCWYAHTHGQLQLHARRGWPSGADAGAPRAHAH